jgi:hypothetical protein
VAERLDAKLTDINHPGFFRESEDRHIDLFFPPAAGERLLCSARLLSSPYHLINTSRAYFCPCLNNYRPAEFICRYPSSPVLKNGVYRVLSVELNGRS